MSAIQTHMEVVGPYDLRKGDLIPACGLTMVVHYVTERIMRNGRPIIDITGMVAGRQHTTVAVPSERFTVIR